MKRGAEGVCSFAVFRTCFLCFYFMAHLADCLQGPYLFPLLSVHHMLSAEQVGLLLLATTLSKAVIGFLLGVFCDACSSPGLGCVIYFCFSLVSSLLSRSSSSLAALVAARVFGGTATGLLETSFEAFAAFTTISVYKQQHQTLKQTLAWLTAAGAAAAIAAGITAAAAVHVGGFTAPFFISEIVCWLCLGAYILCRATGVHAPQVTPLQQISSPPSGLLGSFSISRGLPYIISSFVSLLASVVPAVCFCFSFLLRNTAACLSVLLQLCFESSLEVFVLFWPLLLIDLNSTQFTYLALNQQTSAIYKGKQTNDAADALLLWEQRGNGASLQNHFHKALKPADKLVNSSFPSSSTSSSYFSPLPLGLLFSCMMGAVAMGSFLFNFASTRLRLPLHLIIPVSFLVASFSLFLCLSAATPLQLFSFYCLFELCAGLLLPALAVVRSAIIPTAIRSTVPSLPRLFFCVLFLIVSGGRKPQENSLTCFQGAALLLALGGLVSAISGQYLSAGDLGTK